MQLNRKKTKSLILRVLYRIIFSGLGKFISTRVLLRELLDLAWIFERLAFNASYVHYPVLSHPGRMATIGFITPKIKSSYGVLDLGCGQGHYSALLSKLARKVVGVDHNPKNIAAARANYSGSNLEFLSGDAWEYLENSSESFDVLFLAHVLEHVDAPGALLKKFSSKFRHIYVEVPDFDGMLIQTIRQDIGTPFIYTDDDHVNEFGREELLTIILEAGLIVESSEYKNGIQYLWLSKLSA